MNPGERITFTVGGGGIPFNTKIPGSNKIFPLKTPNIFTQRGLPSTVTTCRRTLIAAGGLSGNDPQPGNDDTAYDPTTGGFAGQTGEPGMTIPVSGMQPIVRPGKVPSEGGNDPFARGGEPLSVDPNRGLNGTGKCLAFKCKTCPKKNHDPCGRPKEDCGFLGPEAALRVSDPACICDIPCRANILEPDPNGSLGSGGAGQTLGSPAGKGGDGFIIIRW